jgi:hypothetical protein
MSNSLVASFDRGSGIATGWLAAQTRMVSVVGIVFNCPINGLDHRLNVHELLAGVTRLSAFLYSS